MAAHSDDFGQRFNISLYPQRQLHRRLFLVTA
jgi:hypothetical protein